MSSAVSVANFRRFFQPPVRPAAVEEPHDELPSALATLRALQAVPRELARLDQEDAADQTLLEEIQARQLQRGERRRELDRLRMEEPRATNVILRTTTAETDEERALTEFGKQKMREGGELQSRYRLFVAKMVAPEETDEGKKLQAILAEIAECDEMIKRQDNRDRHPGTSAAENRRRRLQSDVGELQPKVDAYARQYRQWREIQDTRAEAEAAFAKRDELRKEREAKAIAAALKSK